MKSDQAQEQLKTEQNANYSKDRLTRITDLPEHLRTLAYGLEWHDENGKPLPKMDGYYYLPETLNWHRELVYYLAELEAPDRLKVFQALLPEMASEIELACQSFKRLPYQAGWERKPFRATELRNRDRLSLISWLEYIIGPAIGPYQDKPLVWLAQWAPYIGNGYFGQRELGYVFAAAIDRWDETGQEVFDILVSSARGEHPIGMMGRHVTTALLVCERPAGWDFIEKMLLAAQREEGLRQVILETIDEGHPGVFARIVRLILENNLVRFSSVARAVDVWFNFGFDSEDTKAINSILSQVFEGMEDPTRIEQALTEGDGQAVYLALWTVAFNNVFEAIKRAHLLLEDPDVARRFGAIKLLSETNLPEGREILLKALDDSDLRVANLAFRALSRDASNLRGTDLFEKLESLLTRFGLNTEPAPLVWPWPLPAFDATAVKDALVECRGERPLSRLLPYFAGMSAEKRVRVANALVENGYWDAPTRQILFALATDLSPWVRQSAFGLLDKKTLTPEEVPALETMFTRKSSDLRRDILKLLLKQPDQEALASAERLLASSNLQQRVGGLDLLKELVDANRGVENARELVVDFIRRKKTQHPDEEALVKTILSQADEEANICNIFGLIDPVQLTPAIAPEIQNIEIDTPAARAILSSLDELIANNTTTPYAVETWGGTGEFLLGGPGWQYPYPNSNLSLVEDLEKWPLRELWQNWFENRPEKARDGDHFEIIRAYLLLSITTWDLTTWTRLVLNIDPEDDTKTETGTEGAEGEQASKKKIKPKVVHSELVGKLLSWFIRQESIPDADRFILATFENTLALIKPEILKHVGSNGTLIWRQYTNILNHINLSVQYSNWHPKEWNRQDDIKLWQLCHWMDRPYEDAPRARPALPIILKALDAGAANETDLFDQLVSPYPEGNRHYHYYHPRGVFQDWYKVSGRKLPAEFAKYPVLVKVVSRLRQRILEIELPRGAMPTEATDLVLSMRYGGGLDTFVKALKALGSENFIRGYAYDNQSKATVFSHLVRSSFPGETETADLLREAVGKAGLSERRLVEAAVYAPQWANLVEGALSWPKLAEAVWWVHAHTKDNSWTVDPEIKESWTAQVGERTPLSGSDLLEGAVDVEWFWNTYQDLGEVRWALVYDAAKYSSSSGGHIRAKLFADAMLGQVSEEELFGRINVKRNQDAVRALGLVPLRDQNTELSRRYLKIQEFVRTSKQFGAQRQASEKLAGRIGLDNLARTAGFHDPLRLQWAMEAYLVADLKDGPVKVTAGDVEGKLYIDEWGQPQLEYSRSGSGSSKPLKTLPAASKKDSSLALLVERKREIEKQISRMRLSLEEAMVRGDLFKQGDLAELLEHPVLSPMLKKLIFMGNDSFMAGYPGLVEKAVRLRGYAGDLRDVSDQIVLRLAHPYDLYRTGEWSGWQHECFAAERIQPFKQVYRELYLVTQAEKDPLDNTRSGRYSGHQVQPGQALALFKQRGWLASFEEGISRTFHHEGFTARVEILGGLFTPLEVEGITLENIFFTQKGDWRPLPLREIPPFIFSEVMRDLDLVVSVAHRGGVDPEASQSTVEMRGALVEETATLLGLKNVTIKSSHVIIEGELGQYSIHLGSGVVHKLPGWALCIVPVHSQHRGRLFLPFADNDPKTAEVVSKVLLLAKDKEIKDPTILEQIL